MTTQIRTQAIYAYLVLALTGCFLFYKYLLQIFPSVITHQLSQTFHLDGAQLGNLAAFFFYSYLVMQIIAGPLLDRFNPKGILSLAIACSALGAWLFSQADTFALAATARILMGISAAFATVGYMKITDLYFEPKRFAFISGLLTLGVMLGALLAQAPFATLNEHLGWRHSLTWVAGIGFSIAILYMLIVRTPKRTATQTTGAPSVNLNVVFDRLRSLNNWLLVFYSGLAFAPLAVFGGLWGPPYIQEAYHLSVIKSGFDVSMIYVGFGVGGPLFGYLSQRFNDHFKLIQLGLALSALALVMLIYGPLWHNVMLIVWMSLFGVGTGAFMLGFSLGKSMNPAYLAATIVGIINTGDALFGAITEPGIGWLLDRHAHTSSSHAYHFNIGDFHYALTILPVYLIFTLLCITWLQYRLSPSYQKWLRRSNIFSILSL